MASRREQLVGNRLVLAGTVLYFMEWVVIPFAPSLRAVRQRDLARQRKHYANAIACVCSKFRRARPRIRVLHDRQVLQRRSKARCDRTGRQQPRDASENPIESIRWKDRGKKRRQQARGHRS